MEQQTHTKFQDVVFTRKLEGENGFMCKTDIVIRAVKVEYDRCNDEIRFVFFNVASAN